ncbi:MAG: glutamine synthetase, partial [Ignavibacteriales bacterium CG18_big_fil_WC_8_21_14_2_50_31_20]
EIEQVNFQFVNEDGKLKTLNFVVTSRAYLESILSTGERVDGSSLFSYIDASTSDLYVIPRFKTAFVNPFSEVPTINLLCSFYTKEGQPLASAPENILRTASRRFTKATGLKIKALGELEYYIIADKDVNKDYPAQDQKGYHASTPFAKFEFIRTEAIRLLAKCGAKIKYAHSEVGNFTTDEKYYEQHEIEFNAVDVDEAADHLVLGKWILRNLAYKYGVDISFAPKISVGKAGSGLHIHYMIVDEQDNNLMIENDKLSEIAIKTIAGILDKAKALTAFGNTIPTSYLRLVPHQEAPTNICWGESNRSALVRIPLGWILKTEMIKNANPYEIANVPYIPGKQTAEFRVPDGSADIYHLLAGMVMAMQHGIELPNSLEVAESLRIEENLFANDALAENLKHLPTSCAESADELEKEIDFFNTDNVFPLGTLERFVKILRSYNDNNLSEKLFQKHDEIKELVNKYVHYA